MSAGIDGDWVVADRFAHVAELFATHLDEDLAYTAQVCAYEGDRLIFHAWGGPGLGRDGLVCVFSTTKGIVGVCLAMLIERGMLDPDVPVHRYWPEFAAAGKEGVTVRDLLSHRAGLSEVDGGLTWPEYVDDTRAAARLAAQRPLWRPGSAWSYHALTFGVLANELFRRVAGESVQAFFEREVRAPRDIDFYLGLPEQLEPRVVPVIVPDPVPASYRPTQLYDLVVAPLAYDPGFDHIANTRESHAAGIPAGGGVASAHGIARTYASVGSSIAGRDRLLSEDTISTVGQVHSSGTDLISGQPGLFGLAFQKPSALRPFAGYRAIGHDGAGGALGFYDPANRLAFGFTTNRLAPPGGELRADAIAIAIAEALG
jgi:CubicO group peptidase (beta-lactamase class C family)